MEAIGRLAGGDQGGKVHDFNNILVSIIGYAELEILNLPPESKLYADLKQIQETAKRAAGLTPPNPSFQLQADIGNASCRP